MKIPDKLYDILKWVTMVVIPALTAAYVGLAAIWGFCLVSARLSITRR